MATSRINIDGECVSDWWDKRRLEKVLRNLESQLGLTPVPCSWEIERAAPSTGQKRRMMREVNQIYNDVTAISKFDLTRKRKVALALRVGAKSPSQQHSALQVL